MSPYDDGGGRGGALKVNRRRAQRLGLVVVYYSGVNKHPEPVPRLRLAPAYVASSPLG